MRPLMRRAEALTISLVAALGTAACTAPDGRLGYRPRLRYLLIETAEDFLRRVHGT